MTKVLIIDDDLELMALLKEYFSDEGFAVETTDDGRRAIAEASDGTVDIILLDIMMPRMLICAEN